MSRMRVNISDFVHDPGVVYAWIIGEASPLGPHGWHCDYAVWLDKEKGELVFEQSDWLTTGSYIRWSSDVRVVSHHADYDIPGYPEEWAPEQLGELLEIIHDTWDLHDIVTSLRERRDGKLILTVVKECAVAHSRHISLPQGNPQLRLGICVLNTLRRVFDGRWDKSALGHLGGDAVEALYQLIAALQEREAVLCLKEEWAREIADSLEEDAERLLSAMTREGGQTC